MGRGEGPNGARTPADPWPRLPPFIRAMDEGLSIPRPRSARVPPVKVSDKLSITGQPAAQDFPSIARQGFAMVINNRPDGEEAAQPGSDAEAAAARAAGLAYLHLPVTGPTLSSGDIRRFQAALARADGPVLAHCRSGARSLTLWVLGEVLDGRMTPEQIRPFGAERGFDLTGALNWLARHGFARPRPSGR